MRRGIRDIAWGVTVTLLLGAAAAANAETFLVNTGADDEQNPPAGSLRAAVEALEPGDTIEFIDGLTVTLETGFEIRDGIDDVTIRGPVRITSPVEKGANVIVQGDRVTLVDLDLSNVDVTTAESDTAPPVEQLSVDACTFGDDSRLILDNAIQPAVRASRFDGNERGRDPELSLNRTALAQIEGNTFGPDGRVTVSDFTSFLTFADNGLEGGGAFFEAKSGTITGNTFRGEEPIRVRFGPAGLNVGKLTVHDNDVFRLVVERLDVEVTDNRVGVVAPAKGKKVKTLEVPGKKAPLLQVIAANPQLPFFPDLAKDVVVRGNTVTGGPAGLLIRDLTDGRVACVVERNTVRGSDGIGLQVLDVADGQVTNNVVEDIGTGAAKRRKKKGGRAVGLRLVAVRDALDVSDNEVRRVDGVGVRIEDESVVDLVGNEIELNAGRGVETAGRGGVVTGSANTVRDNGSGGVHVGKRWSLQMGSGTIDGNQGPGVEVDKRASAELSGLVVGGNKGDGIVFGNKSTGRVQGCEVAENGGAGVRVQKKATVAVRSTLMGGNGEIAIDLDPTKATANDRRKKANDDLDYPEMEIDDESRRLVGTAPPGATVEIFRAAGGEPVELLGTVTAAADGSFEFPESEPLDCADGTEIVATATRPDGRTTSEVSEPVICEVPVIPILRASQDDEGFGGSEESAIEDGVLPLSRAISDDGRWIVFDSRADNLVDDDTNDERDVFVHDAVERTTRRVSLGPGGEQLENSSNLNAGRAPVISGDGRVVFYNTESTTWRDAVGALAYTNIIRTDLTTRAATTVGNVLVEGEPKIGGGGFQLATNRDGTLLAFVHNSTRYYTEDDTNKSDDVYMWLGNDTYEWISRSHDDMPGDDGGRGAFAACNAPRVSADGSVVIFQSLLKGLAPDTPDSFEHRIYVRDRVAGTLDIASRAPDGTPASAGTAALSANGRWVAFATIEALVPEDTDGDSDIYVRDLLEGTTALASPNPDGNASRLRAQAPSITDDGRFVVYELGGTGFNAPSEVWLYDRQESTHRRLSGGFDGFALSQGEHPGITPDGRFVVFQSFQPDLLPDDADQNFQQDVFRRALDEEEE